MFDVLVLRRLASIFPHDEMSISAFAVCNQVELLRQQVEALERENEAMAKVVGAARGVIDRNEAVTFDCSCLGGEQCRMCGQLKTWKLALAALVPATSVDPVCDHKGGADYGCTECDGGWPTSTKATSKETP